jgi:Na+/H+-dicarboxylate symporter
MRIIINKIWQFKLPVMLVMIMLFAFWVGPHLSITVQSFLYFLSEAFKKLLSFVLPFIIFSLILASIVHIKAGAIRLILLLIPLILISNYASMWIAYLAGDIIVKNAEMTLLTNVTTKSLEPLWNFNLPSLISSEYAMIAAVLLGLLSTAYFPVQGKRVAAVLSKITAFILNKLVLPLLPVFILGIVIKMQYDDILEEMIYNYARIFALVAAVQVIYIVGLYFVVSKFRPMVCLNYLKNMFPPLITAFSTMSSAITMPLTLIATRKNVHDPDVVNFVIPSTVSFHTIGDIIAMPILFMAIMLSFGFDMPTIPQYFMFSLYYSLARFSSASIPGGGGLILIPLLESHFHFTTDMLGLTTTLNLMFDPMITAMNVLGNGVFAIVFAKIYHVIRKPDPVLTSN